MPKANSAAHTKWLCKYHIVFTPKYRRKIIYNQYKKDLAQILHDLCTYKGVEIRRDYRRTFDARSCAYASEHTAEDSCVVFYGLPEREKLAEDVRSACESEV